MRSRAPIGKVWVGVVLCLAGAALVSAISPFARYVIHHRGIDPLMFAGIWLLSAGVWAWLFSGNRRGIVHVLRNHAPVLLLVGALHLCAACTQFWAIRYVSSPVHGFLLAMSFPLAFLLGVVLLGDRARWPQIVGLVLAVGGLLMFLRPDRGASATALGTALTLLAAVFCATIDVVAKTTAGRTPTWAIVCFRALIPGTILLVVCFLFRDVQVPDAGLLAAMVGGAIFGPYLAYWLTFRSFAYLSLPAASVLRSLTPVMTAVLAAVALGETLGWAQAGAGVVIVVGAALAPAGAATAKPTSKT